MRVIVTGSNGLSGSNPAAHFDRLGPDWVGIWPREMLHQIIDAWPNREAASVPEAF